MNEFIKTIESIEINHEDIKQWRDRRLTNLLKK